MRILFRIFLICFLINPNIWANEPIREWYKQQPDKKVTLNVDLFLSSTCPHCQKADLFFRTIELANPWMHVTRHVINENKNDLILFNQFLSEQQSDDFAVPSIFFCNSRWVGFASDKTTGKDLLQALNYCKERIEKKGTLSEVTVNVLRRWGSANLFDSGMIGNPSPFSYLLVIALTDAFNPCSWFCIAAFFAFLFITSDSRKHYLHGLLFILAIGIVHYIQQIHSTLFFEVLPWLRIPAALIALLTMYGVGEYYKKGRYATWFVTLPFLFAFMVYAYQQTCLMNWSYVFEQWLYNRQVADSTRFIYQLAYQVIYLAPLLAMLFLYRFLIARNWFITSADRLKIIGLLLIGAIALLLLIYPWILVQMFGSIAVILGAIIISWFIFKAKEKNE